MTRKAIYTCLVGGYEQLLQPEVVDNDFDYICFSNDIHDSQVGVWKIKKIPYQHELSSRLSRYVKILPHKVLPGYDYSVWMDANIQIKERFFYEKVNHRILEGHLVAQVPHPTSKDVYEEIRNAYYGEKTDWRSAKNMLTYLRKNGYPQSQGVFENNLILRKHNDTRIISISEDWWQEFCYSAPRDQFSLMYVYWKHHYKPCYLFDATHNARNVSFLKYHIHPSMQRRNDYYDSHHLLRVLNAVRKKLVVSLLLR